MSEPVSMHLYIEGRVQGVFYRASARDEARRLGLSGWVKNLPDGRVELLAEGPRDRLEQLLAWCRQGPPAARVDDVTVEWGEYSGSYDGFEVAW
ncbi:MAG: acylphosphatase [Deltaproteobacteria bacterium]|nr:MAG: acylphosphatase [Deltaproteobacteria bacterium]